jgi:hypothetical protein
MVLAANQYIGILLNSDMGIQVSEGSLGRLLGGISKIHRHHCTPTFQSMSID